MQDSTTGAAGTTGASSAPADTANCTTDAAPNLKAISGAIAGLTTHRVEMVVVTADGDLKLNGRLGRLQAWGARPDTAVFVLLDDSVVDEKTIVPMDQGEFDGTAADGTHVEDWYESVDGSPANQPPAPNPNEPPLMRVVSNSGADGVYIIDTTADEFVHDVGGELLRVVRVNPEDLVVSSAEPVDGRPAIHVEFTPAPGTAS